MLALRILISALLLAASACTPAPDPIAADTVAIARLKLPTTAALLATLAGREGERLGVSVLALPDLDGDGAADLAVGALPGPADAHHRTGGLIVFARKGAAELWRRDAPHPGAASRFAERTAAIGDVDGDLLADLIVSDWSAEGGRGAVELLSSKSGELRVRIEGLPPLERELGAGLASAGDADGDAIPDLALACSNGAGRIFSGRHGAPLGQFRGAPLGLSGDLDGDGRSDLLVLDGPPRDAALRWNPRGLGARLVATPTGVPLLELVPTEEVSALEAHGPVGDLDQDGFLDWAAAYRPGVAENEFVAGPRERLVLALSGRTGRALSSLRFHMGGRGRVHLVAAAGDVDGDGRSDVLVAWHLEVGTPQGFVNIYRGADGQLLHQLASTNWSFATSATVLRDWNEDGRNEIALGEPLSSEEGRESGRVYVISFPARP